MNDLIRRSEAIKLLRKNMSNDIQDQIATENNINLIESLPTAFDTEKVVEQLEKAKDNHVPTINGKTKMRDLEVYKMTMGYAIDIVKKGGGE